MREEILTFIEKNSRVDLKELAIIVARALIRSLSAFTTIRKYVPCI